jgi:type III pantothenate kinase
MMQSYSNNSMTEKIWIGLAIGNSRYHWAWFLDTQLQTSWDTAYLSTESIEIFPIDLQQMIAKHQIEIPQISIYLASVVPHQTVIWQQLERVKQITLADIPLCDLYPTLGIDRALAILGAGKNYGYPVLVIDGGTALTITGVDDRASLVGGAIMPGLKLQFNSLSTGTAALPEIGLPSQLPPRWNDNTAGAIASGILYTISAGISDFIDDWVGLFPGSKVIFTGGDGERLVGYLQSRSSVNLSERIKVDRHLIFDGLAEIYRRDRL